MLRKHARFVVGVPIVIAVSLIGAYFLYLGHAAAPVVSVEPETGTIKTPAAVVNDAAASATKAVKFGQATPTTCANPVFTTSDPNGGWSTNGYYVHNNMWYAGPAPVGPETLYACAYNNWYVISNQSDSSADAGAVKTYPNVHKDYDNVPISSFSRILSTYAGSSPHVGIYDVAYDIWINDQAIEVMIWTDNYNQVPGGSKAATVAFGGVTYNVYRTGSGDYIAFVPSSVIPSGSLDLLQMFNWITSKGWMSSSATLSQIDYGVEVVSTSGTNARWNFTDFSITDN